MLGGGDDGDTAGTVIADVFLGKRKGFLGDAGVQRGFVGDADAPDGIVDMADRFDCGNVQAFMLGEAGGEVGNLLRVAIVDGQLVEVPVFGAEQPVHGFRP